MKFGVFGNTYTCEQAFLCMKQNKSKLHSRITNVNICDVNWHFENGTKCHISCEAKTGPSFTLIRKVQIIFIIMFSFMLVMLDMPHAKKVDHH